MPKLSLQRKKLLIGCGVAVILAALALYVMIVLIMRSPTSDPTIGSRISVSGQVACLPPKDTGRPQTLECAIGLQASDGRYYALKPGTSAAPIGQQTGATIRVEGILNAPAADERYDIVGTISVDSTSP